jgi:hypothetical protein
MATRPVAALVVPPPSIATFPGGHTSVRNFTLRAVSRGLVFDYLAVIYPHIKGHQRRARGRPLTSTSRTCGWHRRSIQGSPALSHSNSGFGHARRARPGCLMPRQQAATCQGARRAVQRCGCEQGRLTDAIARCGCEVGGRPHPASVGPIIWPSSHRFVGCFL